MKATDTEIKIINALLFCRFQPGSFDKKLPKQIDINNISPLQQWYIHKLCYKYRKQISNDILLTISINFLKDRPAPLSRKQAEKLAKGKAIKTITEIVNIKTNTIKHKDQLSIF